MNLYGDPVIPREILSNYHFFMKETLAECIQNAKILRISPEVACATRFELELDNDRTIMFTSMESGVVCFACRSSLPLPTNVPEHAPPLAGASSETGGEV